MGAYREGGRWQLRGNALPLLFASLAWMLLATNAHSQDFLLNFEFSPNSLGTGQTGGCLNGGPVWGDMKCPQNGDPSRFEMSWQVIDGVEYFRTVVGDPASGFAMESYTRREGGFHANDPFSGGNERAHVSNIFFDPQTGQDSVGQFPASGHVGDPFGETLATNSFNLSGNGTANPDKTVFRMVLNDSQMSMEVSKPIEEKKAKISQTVQDGALRSQFVADARALGFDDANTSAQVINRLVIDDPTLPVVGAADFEMAFAQKSTVDAGRYSFTPGTGWNDSAGWFAIGSEFDEGTYNYAGSSFNVFGVDWGNFFDPAQNQENCFGADEGITSSNRADIYTASCPQ